MLVPRFLTTPITLSKTIAILLYFILPLYGFYVGMNYQREVSLQGTKPVQTSPAISQTPSPSYPSIRKEQLQIIEDRRKKYYEKLLNTDYNLSSWKTYNKLGVSFKYPSNWIVKDTFPGTKEEPGFDSLGYADPDGYSIVRLTYYKNPKSLPLKEFQEEVPLIHKRSATLQVK